MEFPENSSSTHDSGTESVSPMESPQSTKDSGGAGGSKLRPIGFEDGLDKYRMNADGHIIRLGPPKKRSLPVAPIIQKRRSSVLVFKDQLEKLSNEQLIARVMQLDHENSKLVSTIPYLEVQLEASETNKYNLSKELTRTKETCDELQSELDESHRHGRQLESSLRANKTMSSELLAELDSLKTAAEQLNLDNKRTQADIENAESFRSREMARAESLGSELLKNQDQNSTMTKALRTALDERDELTIELRDARNTIANLRDDLDRMEGGVDDLETQLAHLQHENVIEKKASVERVTDLKAELETSTLKLEETELQLKTTQKNFVEVTEKDEQKARELTLVMEDQAMHEEAIERLQSEVGDLVDLVNEYESQLEMYKHEIKELTVKNDELVSEISELSHRESELESELTVATVNIADMEQTISLTKNNYDESHAEHNDIDTMLSGMEFQLSNANFKCAKLQFECEVLKSDQVQQLHQIKIQITIEKAEEQWREQKRALRLRTVQKRALKTIDTQIGFFTSVFFKNTRKALLSIVELIEPHTDITDSPSSFFANTNPPLHPQRNVNPNHQPTVQPQALTL
eukprot:m.197055 g.197055  ORF g.197055 m.197055 type:complete len:578 (+) comp32646_c0_seq1:446-2179(+)